MITLTIIQQIPKGDYEIISDTGLKTVHDYDALISILDNKFQECNSKQSIKEKIVYFLENEL